MCPIGHYTWSLQRVGIIMSVNLWRGREFEIYSVKG